AGRPHAVTADGAGSVRVWDLTTGVQTRELIGHKRGVNAVAIIESAVQPQAVTADNAGSVRVWDLATGMQAGDLPNHESAVNDVVVTTLSGRPHVVTGSSGSAPSVHLWDVRKRACVSRFHCPVSVTSLALAGNTTAIVGFGSEVAVLDFSCVEGKFF
ncbi:WD40 repeat domain-containing protein, partial [Streptomyces sp. NPDC101249]|uniref:WD40 repeat domain-containing protein n=1 Tax=Streptomyces sp. NPDC101249 TaxID=3366140 RepID=UPI00382100B9